MKEEYNTHDKAGNAYGKLVEINKTELKPGAKYVFLLSPDQTSWLGAVKDEMNRLIGEDNFTLLPLHESSLKVYEITEK